jgi:hypothetical protein
MQQAPFKIADHGVVVWVTRQRSCDFIFETCLSSFEVKNAFGLCHEILACVSVAAMPPVPSRCDGSPKELKNPT